MPPSPPVQQTGQTKGWLTGLALTTLLAVTGCSTGGAARGYSNVTVSELHTQMQQGNAAQKGFLIVDVRTPGEYRTGHIRGALLIPVDTLRSHLSEIPRDRPIYVYCQGGKRSARAASLLAGHGYTLIRNVQGGIIAWRKSGYELLQ